MRRQGREKEEEEVVKKKDFFLLPEAPNAALFESSVSPSTTTSIQHAPRTSLPPSFLASRAPSGARHACQSRTRGRDQAQGLWREGKREVRMTHGCFFSGVAVPVSSRSPSSREARRDEIFQLSFLTSPLLSFFSSSVTNTKKRKETALPLRLPPPKLSSSSSSRRPRRKSSSGSRAPSFRVCAPSPFLISTRTPGR